MKNLTWLMMMLITASCSLLPGVSLNGAQDKPGAPVNVLTSVPTSTPVSAPANTPTSASVSAPTRAHLADLPDYGAAPELTNQIWLNVDHPLYLADLRGQVVMIEMWTLGCINCQHVIPSLRDWYAKYKAQGFVIIGNHFPEFEYEAKLDNLKQALKQYQIEYPVAQDNAGVTWNAYQNRYWPSLFLVDKRGHIRYRHIGEGAYDTTEAAIQSLLAESYL
jgi:thiol-disulfide isomerase/thioredoxin